MNSLKQLFTRRRHFDELSKSMQEHLEEKFANPDTTSITRACVRKL